MSCLCIGQDHPLYHCRGMYQDPFLTAAAAAAAAAAATYPERLQLGTQPYPAGYAAARYAIPTVAAPATPAYAAAG